MAGAQGEHPSLPGRGKVQEVRRQWAVHEDGALAYHMQNEEITEHYGLNRFHRQMVREDIPVAKFVQSEEELRQQEERLRQLEILKAQAEEDAKMAEKISRRVRREKTEVIKHSESPDMDDEELARQLQEKEKKKYERHLEKKKERKLKKERQLLEEALAKDLEEARLAHNSENGSDRVSASIESLNLQGVSSTRVTPSGRIEDEGDFSDFYNLPDEMDEYTRLEIQASQDEELARLLQEQEHKRTKAKVDQEKLRRIEHRDEQLARIIQEQEQLRLKKAKLKHQARKEAMRQMSVESMPLGTSANSLKLQKHLPADQVSPAAIPISDSGHQRYRSNSYTRACDSPPSPPRTPPPHRLISDGAYIGHGQRRVQSDQSIDSDGSQNHTNQQYFKSQNAIAQPSSSSSSPRPARSGPSRGMSTLESARQIAAGNPEGILALQNPQRPSDDQKVRSLSLQEHAASSKVSHIHRQQGNVSKSDRELAEPRRPSEHTQPHRPSEHPQPYRLAEHAQPHRPAEHAQPQRSTEHSQIDSEIYSQPYNPHAVHSGTDLRHSDAFHSQGVRTNQFGISKSNVAESTRAHRVDQQPGRSGLYSRREEDDPHPYPSAGTAGFNIAAAIDPTYQRRHPEASLVQDTQLTSNISYSLPQSDGDLEWDPNLRGSLRKTKSPILGYQGSTAAGSLDRGDTMAGEQVLSSWQPVQGQRRRDPASRGKLQKQNLAGNDGKGNCKQQ